LTRAAYGKVRRGRWINSRKHGRLIAARAMKHSAEFMDGLKSLLTGRYSWRAMKAGRLAGAAWRR